LTPNKQTPKFQNFILKQNLQKKVQLLAIWDEIEFFYTTK
jgi:hypothetical protein